MEKRFLVLVDFSDYSAGLVRFAADWSTKVKASIVLVHQTIVLAPGMLDNETKQQFAEDDNNNALHQLKKLADAFVPPTVKVSYSVSESHLENTLNELLAEPFNHLIFTGIKGTGLLKKIFLGSVALQVIENINNVVVAIPKGVSSFKHTRAYIAVSEDHPLNYFELNKFLGFVGSRIMQLTFFHLAQPADQKAEIEESLGKVAALFTHRFHTEVAVYEEADAIEGIKNIISNKHEEMLVVQRGSRLLTDQLFRRLLINELVYEGQTPLVVIP
ncbi:universal stress protein [Paracnuella aquatica]|uniref:universal stress protein n=1 Tax=Paracnuella aquatica TaxID=2268757 RepID=UPI000DEEE53F|nr:universal stress protein [Paracnuella aquatica]RPD51663.1 universal stress protein [Paracnuella aquatica]